MMKVKEESKKVGLKFNIQKTKIIASGPITSWQIQGEKVETMIDFLFLASKIPADGDYSHEMKRCLLLGRKGMTNLDSVLKSRDITLSTKLRIIKAIVFLAEHQRVCTFKLWCWRRLLRVPWEARTSNQSILKEINPEYSLEGLMLKL